MKLRTVGITLTLGLGIFSAPLASDAQQSTKLPRLGYLSPGTVPHYDNAFLQGLQDQGYILPGVAGRRLGRRLRSQRAAPMVTAVSGGWCSMTKDPDRFTGDQPCARTHWRS